MTKLLRTIFLVDLFQGLWVTFRTQHPKNIVTEQYPEHRPKIAERYRGAPRLNINTRLVSVSRSSSPVTRMKWPMWLVKSCSS